MLGYSAIEIDEWHIINNIRQCDERELAFGRFWTNCFISETALKSNNWIWFKGVNGNGEVHNFYSSKYIIGILKQEVLERTNRLLSLIRHRPHWKRRVQQFFYCCASIHYRNNVSTEPLPSNDRGGFTDTHTHTHTCRQQRDLISLLYFSEIGK
jgi:hypothetical protein